ncbi:MAG: nitroreductase family protein [Lactobacillus sp.]|nr:nitroreductase family protein [Lactobacillus sp.]
MKTIKKFLSPKTTLRSIKNRVILKKLYTNDFNNFYHSFSLDDSKSNIEQLEAKLLFFAHSLEKGLSHGNFRAGFGIGVLNNLAESISIYNQKEFDRTKEKYQIALSALKHYQKFHEEKNYSIEFFKKIFSNDILTEIAAADLDLSGVKIVSNCEKITNKKKNFEELALGRTSIREFDSTPVSNEKVCHAIQIALKTPSVCNRQPARVYQVTNQEKIEELLKVQGGYNGYPLPPVLLLVTASNTSFIYLVERNEGFIDGGLFSMSLLYGLEYEGLAACALNAMLTIEKEKEIRRILELPKEENLIMFIAVGNIPQLIKSPKSHRVSIESVLTKIQ